MSDQVISFVANDAYLPHAKSVMVNCRRQGSYTGDFCMISPQGCAVDFEQRGINVLRVPDDQWSFLTKFWAFTPFFHRWKQAFCIDLDIIVQGPLQKVFDGLGPRLPTMGLNLEDGSILLGLQYWDTQSGAGPEAHPELYERLIARFPHVTQRMFNMAFMFYEPASIPVDTKDKLLAIHEEFKDLNPSNADQMVINLLLYDRMEEVTKDYFGFCGFDWPMNYIPSEFRKWRGDEVPVLLHFCRWSAPWIEKPFTNGPGWTPDDANQMLGYWNHRLGRPCFDVYQENLAAFEQEFPIL